MSAAFAALQRLLPQHALSRGIGRLARSETPWLRRAMIHAFARTYDVDMHEAEREDLDDYRCFNDFFTRALKPGARPLAQEPNALLSPADGTVSQAGTLEADRLLQAKGTSYRLRSLAGADCPEFEGGTFVTIYLAPGDYHRVHLPTAGRLTRTTDVPGELFSVNARTEAAVTDLFCRNERLVCRFETAHGALLLVLVGAMIVASIETGWGSSPSPYRQVAHRDWELPFERGAEVGRFLLGSTVILCWEPGRVQLDERVRPGQRVRMGERLGLLGD